MLIPTEEVKTKAFAILHKGQIAVVTPIPFLILGPMGLLQYLFGQFFRDTFSEDGQGHLHLDLYSWSYRRNHAKVVKRERERDRESAREREIEIDRERERERLRLTVRVRYSIEILCVDLVLYAYRVMPCDVHLFPTFREAGIAVVAGGGPTPGGPVW